MGSPGPAAAMSTTLRYDRHEVAEAKSAASLQRIVGETVRLIRDGRRWVGLCPIHSERTPSLTIFADGHFHCYGCGAHGDVVTWLMRVRGFSFCDALAYLGATPTEGRPQQPTYVATPSASPTRDAAIRCWTEAIPARGTIVEAYLATRGLCLPDDPPIRFHPECQRGPRDARGTATFAPAMICLLVDPVTAKPTGVHRTYLTPTDAKAPAIHRDGRVIPSKSILGNWGCIRLAPPNETRRTLGIAEGLENALSAHALGWDWGPVWAAGSAANIANFPIIPWVATLNIFADSDPVGVKAAQACETRWLAAGKYVDVHTPNHPGVDWNDLVLQRRTN